MLQSTTLFICALTTICLDFQHQISSASFRLQQVTTKLVVAAVDGPGEVINSSEYGDTSIQVPPSDHRSSRYPPM